jgi:integrase/recombinase XerD
VLVPSVTEVIEVPRTQQDIVESALYGSGAQVVLPAEGSQDKAQRAAYEWLAGFQDTPNTLRSYAASIRVWFQFCAAAGVDPLQARRVLVEQYKATLFDQGLAASTVSQRLSGLNSFYTFCDDDELIRRNPLRGVRRPKLPNESTSTGLTREELNAFLVEAKKRGPMLYALMMLLALNGLRAAEPCLAHLDDLSTMRGHHTLRVERKGTAGSKTIIPLAPVTADAVDTWVTQRALDLGQIGRGTGLLFFTFARSDTVARTGEVLKTINRRDIYRYVKSIGAIAVPHKTDVSPHSLRHSFVTLSLDSGCSLRDTRDAAGHINVNTTSRYDRGRNKIDRHTTYTLAAYLAGAE